ncbi:MAG: hypothetical protein L3J31_07420 [Bacteroidales bacterium]|nr:hypothetical protein [Bacteroidales bacterium]MCF6342617.1 hypothetical protein [Bacteroidales bacterium]
MKKLLGIFIFCGLIVFCGRQARAQISVTDQPTLTNSASRLLMSNKKLTFGGYGQLDYNQPFGNESIQNGKLDVHRLVLLFAYNFTSRLSLVTEIEVEHVQEVYIEQSFLNYALNTYVNLRGGLMLIPMGIINENHEPPIYNGVERPLIDLYIVPSTWREIGLGLTGTIPEISMKYQAYLVNGFKSYDGQARLSGRYGLRKGRQKGIESMVRTPGLTTRIEYYGLLGLNLGLSTYFGQTQSTLFKRIEKSRAGEIARADSSVVGVSMFGFDLRFQRKGIQIRGQGYYTLLSNTGAYNDFTVAEGKPNDLGSSMYGYYLEAAYNVFYPSRKIRSELTPFVRYSVYDTQLTLVNDLSRIEAYNVTAITTGIGWRIVPGAVLKADVQFIKSKADVKFQKVFNAGIGFWF